MVSMPIRQIIINFILMLFIMISLDNWLFIIPLIFIFCIAFATNVFELLNHRNVPVMILVSVILAMLGLLTYIQFFADSQISFRNFYCYILSILIIYGLLFFKIREWNKLNWAESLNKSNN
ncbi:MAG TPA: hypothetical protein PLC38_00585 [Methanobacterium sp.]|jgi:CDP-diglyceride synthetase|nr:MAG: hypothetical protein FGO69_01710 [Methanobacterium sp.]HOI70762.1 hypothetical protein [Methanobacterium sp.]